jgi:hypothetical protein
MPPDTETLDDGGIRNINWKKGKGKMDQYPGSGEGGGFIAPQGIAPDYTPAFTPVQAPPKKKKRWIWIAGAGVVIVAAALVLVLCLSPKPGGGAVPDPMVYAEGEDVFLAAGAESIQLDDASFVEGYESRYLNAPLSADGKTLYYLADVSSSSGEGDLMRVSVGSEKARPECIAQDVYSAKISADGKKVLYLSDYKDGGGDLYLCAPGGDAEKKVRGQYLRLMEQYEPFELGDDEVLERLDAYPHNGE